MQFASKEFTLGQTSKGGRTRFVKKPFGNRICSVGRAIEILGDRWSLAILREAFFGVRYYDGFQSNLGIATNILSDRLKVLVEHGIIAKKKDQKDARRVEYKLTRKGIELYSVVLALLRWGDRWLCGEEDPPLALTHEKCGHPLVPVMCCAHCGHEVRAYEVSYQPNPAVKKLDCP